MKVDVIYDLILYDNTDVHTVNIKTDLTLHILAT